MLKILRWLVHITGFHLTVNTKRSNHSTHRCKFFKLWWNSFLFWPVDGSPKLNLHFWTDGKVVAVHFPVSYAAWMRHTIVGNFLKFTSPPPRRFSRPMTRRQERTAWLHFHLFSLMLWSKHWLARTQCRWNVKLKRSRYFYNSLNSCSGS